MKRIDRILISALDNSCRNEEISREKRADVFPTAANQNAIHKARHNIPKKTVGFLLPTCYQGAGDSPTASVAPLMTAPAINQSQSAGDSPTASVAPLMTAPAINQLQNDISSPVAPLYSPLTPLLAATRNAETERNLSMDISGSEKSSSPLPPMSPETLKLFQTLSRTFPSENTEGFVEFSTPAEDKSNRENIEMEEIDISCDDDSDYVPDSEEDSDYEHKTQEGSNALLGWKNRLIPDSEDDTDDDTPRSFLPSHAAQSVENPEEVLVTAYCDEETVAYPDNLVSNSEFQNQESVNQNLEIETNSEQNTSQTGRAKKGRKRTYAEHSLAQRKERKYKNLPYNTKRKRVESKVFQNYACTCTRQCFVKVSQEERRSEFDKYIELGSYEAQLLFITNNVEEAPKKRSYTLTKNKSGKNKPKAYRRRYYISSVEVCKDMFLHNFQISSKKVDVSLLKKRTNRSLKDNRGFQQGGWNKTPEEEVEFVKKVINSLPKYESHYRREKNGDCLYLKPGMTVQKIYEIYVEKFKAVHGESKKPVSFETLKKIFYKNFNLRCKSLKKDTCNKCDTLAQKINNSTSIDEKLVFEKEKEDHLKRAQELRQQMNDDISRAKTDQTFECLTFDLEKTLPLPRIPTNIVFYKRQLWLYNCGIHNGSKDTGHCNVWLEGEAGRGAQEVGSCLIHYIKNNIDANVTELALWSDCCGGQNRNIKIVLMLKALLHSHPTLQTIRLKYLESGHTFLPNDTDFSKIEYQLKYHERLYTAEEYINVIKSCKKKNPLIPYRMQKEDFFGTSKIEKKIVNRKVFTNKEKVNWLKTKKILLKKLCKHSIFMNIDGEEKEIDIKKTIKGKIILHITENDFVCLWPDGKEIAQAKLDDLKSMMHLIPKDCQGFYNTLNGMNFVEDVDGIGSHPDFAVDQDENFDDII